MIQTSTRGVARRTKALRARAMAQPQHNETHKTGNRSEKRSTKAYLRKDGRQQKPETKIVDGIKKNVKCVQTKGAFGNVKH